ncbi:MAG TPA: hypothetical protein PKE47_02885 [Verrucomicrobiota bacterium]|nr:hypothetical protein [Verrucomicrobiota bacterium]
MKLDPILRRAALAACLLQALRVFAIQSAPVLSSCRFEQDNHAEQEETVELRLEPPVAGLDHGKDVRSPRTTAGVALPEDPLPVHWRFRESGTTGTLRAVVHALGRFVVVGGDQDAVILSSSDGEHWQRQEAGDASGLADVVFAGGQFVAVGGQRPRFWNDPSTATVLTSTDGLVWEARAIPTTNALLGIAYGNGTYVAVGTSRAILYSPDGFHWSESTVPTNSSMHQIAFGGGRFIAIGNSVLIQSTNGVSWEILRSPQVLPGWTLAEVDGFSRPAIVHAAGRWLFRGKPGIGFAKEGHCDQPIMQAAVVSADAENWNTSLRMISRLRHLGGHFIAVGGANDYCGHAVAIQSSPDGLTWSDGRVVTAVPFDGTDRDLHGCNDVGWDGRAYVAVGTRGRIIQSVTRPVPLEVELSFGETPELTVRGPAGKLVVVESSDHPIHGWAALPLRPAGERPDGVNWDASPEPYPWLSGRPAPAVLDPVVRIAERSLSSLPGARFYRARTLSAADTGHLLPPFAPEADP